MNNEQLSKENDQLWIIIHGHQRELESLSKKTAFRGLAYRMLRGTIDSLDEKLTPLLQEDE